jgi:hypothetical protein
MTSITRAQLTRLQTLYSQWERHSLDCPGPSREQRIAWAAAEVKRPVDSFSKLTLDEGTRLIDLLQNAVGRKFPAQKKKRAKTTRDTEKQGTEGRHDQIHAESTLAGPEAFAMIQRDLDSLGWDEARLEGFLRSRRGPLQGRTVVRTLGDANRVHWALKRILQYQLQKAAS